MPLLATIAVIVLVLILVHLHFIQQAIEKSVPETTNTELLNELVNVRTEIADLREQFRQTFDYPLSVEVRTRR